MTLKREKKNIFAQSRYEYVSNVNFLRGLTETHKTLGMVHLIRSQLFLFLFANFVNILCGILYRCSHHQTKTLIYCCWYKNFT